MRNMWNIKKEGDKITGNWKNKIVRYMQKAKNKVKKSTWGANGILWEVHKSGKVSSRMPVFTIENLK
jgi:hypothetical protein